MQTYDSWINTKIAEALAKEQKAIAILDQIEARRPQRSTEERDKTELLKTEAQPEQ